VQDLSPHLRGALARPRCDLWSLHPARMLELPQSRWICVRL